VWIPCGDTISQILRSRSKVGSIAGDLESWVTAVIDKTIIDPWELTLFSSLLTGWNLSLLVELGELVCVSVNPS
jgi:hypothetical protein